MFQLTEIKVLIKNISDIDLENIDQIAAFQKEPCEIFIDGVKQTDVKYFGIDLPLEAWGKDGKYSLSNPGWSYTLKKNISADEKH